MLFDPLDHILGSKTKVRLLRTLFTVSHPVSGREAARRAGVSSIAQKSLDELARVGIVERTVTSGQHLYAIRREHRLCAGLEKVFGEESELSNEIIDHLVRIFEGAKGVVAAAIFGSTARGETEAGSDLDLLVVVKNPAQIEPAEDKLNMSAMEFVDRYGVRLSPVVISTDQASQQYEEGAPLIRSVIAEGRRIYGAYLEEVVHGQAG